MQSYSLKIADYIIHLKKASEGLDLVAAERFKGFFTEDSDADITIRVHKEKYEIPKEFKLVFKAPYVEEIDNEPIEKTDDFWSVFAYFDKLLINIKYPSGNPGRESWLRFSLTDTIWDLFLDTGQTLLDPLAYPLDGLVLYYLTVIKGDIFIHGSGVEYNNKGFLFTGASGRGKTTMAKLWDENGGKVIHDDRLIIRYIQGRHIMYNTPVYNNDNPSQSQLDKIFVIYHGARNDQQKLLGANALTNIMANCIQHNWSHDNINRLTGSLINMNNQLPVYKLYFQPDKSAINYIISNE